MRELKFKVWTGKEMIGPFDLSQHPMYWAHELQDGERLLFTGLKDKDGVEIYEGDLVEHDMEINGLWEPYEACKVVFSEEYGIFCFEWDAPNVLGEYENHKVIGNIYEQEEQK